MSTQTSNRRSFMEKCSMAALTMMGVAGFPANASAEGAAAPGVHLDAVSTPKVPVPAQSCDCHVHVFDPQRFAYVPSRTYTPGPATVADVKAFLRKLGMGRVVLVQPSGYGSDNSCLLDALGQLGLSKARGVAVIDPARVRRTDLDAMHAKGVRAIRLNLEVKGEHNTERTREGLRQAIDAVQPLGWAIQIYADLPVIEGVADALAASPVPIVLDHFGGLKAERGLNQPGFASLLKLLRSTNVHVKLSAPYRASKRPDFDDLAPFARAMVDAGADNLVWASDWPHTGSSGKRSGDLSQIEPFRVIDDGRVLDLLAVWVPDAAVRHRILVDNAARLFHFGG